MIPLSLDLYIIENVYNRIEHLNAITSQFSIIMIPVEQEIALKNEMLNPRRLNGTRTTGRKDQSR